jgi:DNA-directed RNA polymerase subunit RPC12/RpoP
MAIAMEQCFDEGMNYEYRCDECNEPFDTITIIRKNALCSTCAYPILMDRSHFTMNLTYFNNHLEKVETLLYKLSSDNRVSVKWFLPLLAAFMKNWKIGIGLYEIDTLKMISRDWRIDDIDLIKVLTVVTILRKMRDQLKLNMKKLCSSLSKC